MKKANIRGRVSNFLNKRGISFVNLNNKRTTKKEFVKYMADSMHDLVEWECTYSGCHNRTYSPHIKYCSEACAKTAKQKHVRKGHYDKNCVWCDRAFQTNFKNKIFCSAVCLREKTNFTKRSESLSKERYKEMHIRYNSLKKKYGWPDL